MYVHVEAKMERNDDATRALLTVWANERIQSQLEGQTRNKSVFESIVAELADLGYERKCVSKLSLSTDFP